MEIISITLPATTSIIPIVPIMFHLLSVRFPGGYFPVFSPMTLTTAAAAVSTAAAISNILSPPFIYILLRGFRFLTGFINFSHHHYYLPRDDSPFNAPTPISRIIMSSIGPGKASAGDNMYSANATIIRNFISTHPFIKPCSFSAYGLSLTVCVLYLYSENVLKKAYKITMIRNHSSFHLINSFH